MHAGLARDEIAADIAWMRRALAEAARAGGSGEVPVGAIVVRDDVVIGWGRNAPIGSCDPTAHAEIAALRRAAIASGNYRLAGASLYVTLEPCAMCVGALMQARVARVVFGAADTKAGALGSVFDLNTGVLNHRFEVRGGVLADESAALLQEFFRARRASSARAGSAFAAPELGG
ncbi:MAG: tRNA adenosine(34) deaminase TadA [Deltaproteobacteria bacterium]|nr:tRNA adenosine(34) deaminase TadA [Deltaproteobacteria bacterium]